MYCQIWSRRFVVQKGRTHWGDQAWTIMLQGLCLKYVLEAMCFLLNGCYYCNNIFSVLQHKQKQKGVVFFDPS